MAAEIEDPCSLCTQEGSWWRPALIYGENPWHPRMTPNTRNDSLSCQGHNNTPITCRINPPVTQITDISLGHCSWECVGFPGGMLGKARILGPVCKCHLISQPALESQSTNSDQSWIVFYQPITDDGYTFMIPFSSLARSPQTQVLGFWWYLWGIQWSLCLKFTAVFQQS